MKDPVDREWFAKAFEFYPIQRLVMRWSRGGLKKRPYFYMSEERWCNPDRPRFVTIAQDKDWDIWKGPMK